MADKPSVTNQLLAMFGDENHRVQRAIRLYERKYPYSKDGYNIQIICEIVLRLQKKDKNKKSSKPKPGKLKHKHIYSQSQRNIFSIQNKKKNNRGPFQKKLSMLDTQLGTKINIPPMNKSRSQRSLVPSLFSSDDEYDTQFLEELNNMDYDNDDQKSDASNSNSFCKFMPHLDMEQAKNLQIGQDIDYRRDDGKFVGANIFNIQGTILFIYYHGMSRQNAFRSNYIYDLHRIAIYGSISKRNISTINDSTSNSLRIQSSVKINPHYQNPNINEWIEGVIMQFDIGQVQVQYYNNNYLWVHLDNKNEILLDDYGMNTSMNMSMMNPFSIEYSHSSINISSMKNDNNIEQIIKSDKMIDEVNSFMAHLRKTNWSMDINEKSRARYNNHNAESLFLCIAKEIYDDYKLFDRIRNEYNEYKQENINYFKTIYNDISKNKQQSMHASIGSFYDLITAEDKVCIQLLSELYNIRIKVYEQQYNQLVETFYAGSYANTHQLPLITLAIPYKYEFFVIHNPNCVHQRPLSTGLNQSDERSISIRNKRLLQTNDVFRFYYDLFNYSLFNPNGNNIVNINTHLSTFLLSCNVNRDTFNHIYSVIIGHSKDTLTLHQLISFMNLVYIVQNDYHKQLPQNYSLILNDMSLDSYYSDNDNNNGTNNGANNNIPIMSYPLDFNHPFITRNTSYSTADEIVWSNNEIEEYKSGYPDTNHLPQSISPLTPSPPPLMDKNNSNNQTVTSNKSLSNEMYVTIPTKGTPTPTTGTTRDRDEGKAEMLGDTRRNEHVVMPKPEPIVIDNEDINMKQYEFKRFFDTNMNCPKKDIYYQCFIEHGYNDIGLLLHIDLDTLINECKIDKVYARFFMKKIEEFGESHARFSKFINEELDMHEYWNHFCNAGIKTLAILYERINGFDDITAIIKDEHAAKIIFYELPKIKRQQSVNSDNRGLSNHPTTPFL